MVAKYTRHELDEALRALNSTIAKIEKMEDRPTLGKSQKTLIERRLKALRIAVDLIERERGRSGN